MVRHLSSTLTTTCTSSLSLVLSCVGAGILSFPWALSASRLPAFILVGVAVICCCFVGLAALARQTLLFCAASGSGRDDTWCYDALVRQALSSRRAASFATVAVILNQLGSLVGFLVATADFGVPALEAAFPHLLPTSPTEARATLLSLLGICVFWPLSLAPSLQSLWLPSVLSIVAVAGVAGVVIWRAATRDEPWSACPARGATPSNATLDLAAWPASTTELLECVPILLFGFNCHLQAPLVALETFRARGVLAGWRLFLLIVLPASLSSCALLYAFTALSGVLCFGTETKNDILSNLATGLSTDPLAASAGGAMAIHLVLAFPIVLFPLLRSIDGLRASHATPANGAGTSTANPAPVPLPVPQMLGSALVRDSIRSLSIIATTVAVAVLLGHQLNLVFSALGGTVGAALVCWFPAAVLLGEASDGATRRHRIEATSTGTGAGAGAGTGSGAGAGTSGMEAPMPPGMSPLGWVALDEDGSSARRASARRRRFRWVAAAGLGCLGVLAPLGTFVTILGQTSSSPSSDDNDDGGHRRRLSYASVSLVSSSWLRWLDGALAVAARMGLTWLPPAALVAAVAAVLPHVRSDTRAVLLAVRRRSPGCVDHPATLGPASRLLAENPLPPRCAPARTFA